MNNDLDDVFMIMDDEAEEGVLSAKEYFKKHNIRPRRRDRSVKVTVELLRDGEIKLECQPILTPTVQSYTSPGKSTGFSRMVGMFRKLQQKVWKFLRLKDRTEHSQLLD